MNSNFFDSASQAIHDVIIGTRYLAYKNTDPKTLAGILDRADPLSTALRGSRRVTEDQVADFRLRLQDIEENFTGFEFLVAKFVRNMMAAETKTIEAKRELAAVHASL